MSSRMSHLRDHKFKHNFQDSLNPLCICGRTLKQHLIILSTITISPTERSAFFNPIKEIRPINLTKSDSCITNILLFDNSCLFQK